jgi:UDPglucose 6-dehydrogenase
MDLTVIGTGTIGLVAGSCFAETGHDVTCVDPDEGRIGLLLSGVVPEPEPGLAELVARNVAAGRLRFSTDVRAGIRSGSVLFIATGSREGRGFDGEPAALEQVLQVARTIGRHMTDEKIVVTLSALPVGSARQIRAVIEERTSHPVYVCSSPGALKEGDAVDDFLHPDRVVLGVQSEQARGVLRELYRPFLEGDTPLVFMDLPSAEFSSHASGGGLGSRLGFMNMITRLGGRAASAAPTEPRLRLVRDEGGTP